VVHIFTKWFDAEYAETLCGRIVFSLGFRCSKYPDPEYFHLYRPDCQQCLRKHFNDAKRQP